MKHKNKEHEASEGESTNGKKNQSKVSLLLAETAEKPFFYVHSYVYVVNERRKNKLDHIASIFCT
jgi:hypothetical protein